MKKLIITGIVLVVAALSFFLSDLIRTNDDQGEITIEIVDQIGDTVHHQTMSFVEGDTLLDIMTNNFELRCANNQYQPDTCTTDYLIGNVILSIDGITTDWNNTYIAIYVNDEYSNYGIDEVTLQDGNVYRFEFTVVGDEE